MDIKDALIQRVVQGRSFIDVGGLWGVYGEKVSAAHRYGATELALLDDTSRHHPSWQQMREHLQGLGIDGVELISADVLNATVRPFDVVHSSGVLYHLPNPLQYLARLRSLARRNVVLNSAVFPPDGVENEQGKVALPSSGVLFVPALDEPSRQVMAAYWRSLPVFKVADGTPYGAVGIETPSKFELGDYAPFWWLPTPRAIDAMCECCGFRVLERDFDARYSGYTVLLE